MMSREESETLVVVAQQALAAGVAPITTAYISGRALQLAIPPASTQRGDDASEEFVVYDATDGNPPRQVTIVVSPIDQGDWQLQASADPAPQGVLLVSVGLKSYASRFDESGIARIERIPSQVIMDAEDLDVNIAILPI